MLILLVYFKRQYIDPVRLLFFRASGATKTILSSISIFFNTLIDQKKINK